ncbi:phage tail spike protein [Salinicoccus sesuvii]|uniref:Phage tail spike protein n=1 Tax=Salinicoccus sesuvii TaxID=868281 RepID=A0ABV7N3G6_9STAP
MTSIYLVSQDGEEMLDELKKHIGAHISINEDNTHELTFDIEANARTEVLEQQSRLLVKFMEDWYEFIVQEVDVHYGQNNYRSVKAYPAHDDLKVIHFLPPFSLSARTLSAIMDYILYDSGWQRGRVDYTANQRSFSSESIKSAYDLLREASNLIGHEVRFRIVVNEEQNTITRYVDFVIDNAELSGKEVKFGRDLKRLTKNINYSQVFTQLYVLGPEVEGTTDRLHVTVNDPAAYEIYNRNGQHVQDVYEPQMTAELSGYALTERLRVLGLAELRKRNRHALEWQIEVRRLDNQEDMQHEIYRLHQWLIIRNEYEQSLYRTKVSGLAGRLTDPSSAIVTFSRVEKVGDM